jgi:hypothetical protein
MFKVRVWSFQGMGQLTLAISDYEFSGTFILKEKTVGQPSVTPPHFLHVIKVPQAHGCLYRCCTLSGAGYKGNLLVLLSIGPNPTGPNLFQMYQRKKGMCYRLREVTATGPVRGGTGGGGEPMTISGSWENL